MKTFVIMAMTCYRTVFNEGFPQYFIDNTASKAALSKSVDVERVS